MKIIDKIKKEKFILTVLDNMWYINHPEKIENKKVRNVIKKFKTRQEVYFYLLKKTGKPVDPISKYIYMIIYERLGAKYRKECIEYTKMYLDDILIGEVYQKQNYENRNGYPVSFKEAEAMYKCIFLNSLAELEFKEKNYEEALKYIDIVLETNPKLSHFYVEFKVKILKKLKRDVIPFLEEMQTKEEYKIDENLKDIIEYPERLRFEASRKFFFKMHVDSLLEKETVKI